MNLLQKIELDEIQDKIKAIGYVIYKAACTYEAYTTDLRPRLDALMEKRLELLKALNREV